MSKPIYHWTKSDTIEKIKESKYYKIADSDKKSSLKKRIYGTDNIHQPKNLLGILNRNDGLIIFVGKASRKFKKRYVFAEFTSLFGILSCVGYVNNHYTTCGTRENIKLTIKDIDESKKYDINNVIIVEDIDISFSNDSIFLEILCYIIGFIVSIFLVIPLLMIIVSFLLKPFLNKPSLSSNEEKFIEANVPEYRGTSSK
ncbi:MAG: hypothetical protein NF693_09265 [Bombella sp.]|nr:hypothetical protein [Bombella sp.]